MRLSHPHGLSRRARLIAGATGLAAAAALAIPAATASAQLAPKTFSATELSRTADSVRTADVGGTAWYVDSASGKVVVTVDSTVSKAEIAKIENEAGVNADALVVKHTPVSSPSSSRAARPSPPAEPGAPWASTCRTARAPSSP